MPKIASLYIKTSIWFFATGVFTGLHMATAHHFGMGEMHAYYVPAHTHIVLIGGLVMCGMGFALWLLPSAPPMSHGFASGAPRVMASAIVTWATHAGDTSRS